MEGEEKLENLKSIENALQMWNFLMSPDINFSLLTNYPIFNSPNIIKLEEDAKRLIMSIDSLEYYQEKLYRKDKVLGSL